VKPLFCFYKKNSFVWSTDYQVITCPDSTSVKKFLEEIEKNYFEKLKIVQVNFEYDQDNLFSNQKSLYPSNKATVFIFKEFRLLQSEELNPLLKSYDTKKTSLVFEPLIEKKEFIENTKYIIEQIKLGRIYQVNLTAPLKAFSNCSAEHLYLTYQQQFTGEYKALLPLPDFNLISFSPELFLQKENSVLKTRPIKGSLSSEKVFSNGLLENKKEEAELSMIVDLLRNDLNSLSDEHSACVESHRQQMQLGYIQHTYSEISVQTEASFSFILDKTFPGGSISGCPKAESLKVICEVENFKRQAYTGALGWWQNNDFTLSLTIRSLIHQPDVVFYHAGCGIVYDSKPEDEWNEFLLKTGALNVQE
jgi:para-aminobenzoate synthetase component 1